MKKFTATRTTLYARRHSLQNELAATDTKLAQTIVQLRILQEKEDAYKKNSGSWLAFFWQRAAAQQEEQKREAVGRKSGMLVLEAQLEEPTSARKKQRDLLAQLTRELSVEKEMARNALKAASVAAAQRRQDEARERAKAERERQERQAEEEKAAEREGGWPYYPGITEEEEEIMNKMWREQDEQELQDEIDSWY
jgi:hypothetical protein